MKRDRSRHRLVLGIAVLAACLAAGVASSAPPQEKGKAAKPNADPAPEKEFAVPTPPFTPGIFPCSECHKEMKPNPKRRELKEEHTNIQLKNHAEKERWCLDCHDLKNRDKLRLVSGELIDFTESYRLCGQCHGDKYRDWKSGIHGKRTGQWNGKKQYLLCAHCHNPHNPRFKELHPMPPPMRPENIR